MDSYHDHPRDPLPEKLTSHYIRCLHQAPQEEIEILCHRQSAPLTFINSPWNNCFLLIYTQYSSAHLSWDDGEIVALPPGSFVLLRPRPRFSVQCSENAGEIILVFFRKRLLYQTLLPFLGRSSSVFDFFVRCMDQESPDRLLHFVPPQRSHLHHALFALLVAGSEFSSDMESLKESCLNTLLIFFSRYYRQQHNSKNQKLDLGMLLRYLGEHCTDASLESCAAHFGYNPSYFSRLIHEQSGRNFSELLRDFRLEHACVLLRETELPVSQIAVLAGYNHMGNFYKQFKGKYGFLPKELRDRFSAIQSKKLPD